jgi:hypothetical protein
MDSKKAIFWSTNNNCAKLKPQIDTGVTEEDENYYLNGASRLLQNTETAFNLIKAYSHSKMPNPHGLEKRHFWPTL